MKKLRLRKLWTQEELATAAGISKRTVGNAENGVKRPRPPVTKALCKVFGWPLEKAEELFEEVEE